MNSKDYPLKLAKDIESMLRLLRKFALENSDLIQVISPSVYFFHLKDNGSNFSFTVNTPKFDEKKNTVYNIEFTPRNQFDLEIMRMLGNQEQLLSTLEKWIQRIREYNKINFTEEYYIEAAYQKEFLDEYEIVDENADIEPFNFEQQEKLNKFLIDLVGVLEVNRDKIENSEELIEQTKKLIQDLPKVTKKHFMKNLSVVIGKLRKFGVELFKELMKEAVKEGFKLLIS